MAILANQITTKRSSANHRATSMPFGNPGFLWRYRNHEGYCVKLKSCNGQLKKKCWDQLFKLNSPIPFDFWKQFLETMDLSRLRNYFLCPSPCCSSQQPLPLAWMMSLMNSPEFGGRFVPILNLHLLKNYNFWEPLFKIGRLYSKI